MPHALRRLPALLWAAPALLLVAVFVYYPILNNFWISLYKTGAFVPVPRFVGLGNYQQAWSDPVFWTSLRNNILYAVVSVVIQVGFGLVLAALLENMLAERFQRILRSVYFIPATISITVAGLLFKFLYHPQFGLVNEALAAVGLSEWSRSWLGDPKTAIWGIIAMSQWQATGYVMVLFLVALQRIPRELYQAAYLDGASKIQAFFKITVPLVREMTALLTIVTIAGAFLVFNEVVVMTDGGPANSSHVLGTWLYKSAFFNDDMGYAAAIASIIFLLTLVVAIVQLAYTRRRRVVL
jgi:raffinose/stachyose/melibiose transport system permease protein